MFSVEWKKSAACAVMTLKPVWRRSEVISAVYHFSLGR